MSTDDIFSLPVHPAAEVFPMLPDDELRELADDIKANGLHQPLVVGEAKIEDPETGKLATVLCLVDGRNRRAACKMAGVVPGTLAVDGDPVAYIMSSNIHRRHMTKGQRAMAVAMIFPEPATVKRRGSGSSETEDLGVSANYLSSARTVLKHAPDIADGVLSGSKSLDVAYEQARAIKVAVISDEGKLSELRERYAELADKVIEGELTLAGAKAEADARDEQAAARRQSVFSGLADVMVGLRSFTKPDIPDEIMAWLKDETARKDFIYYCPRGETDILLTIGSLKKQLPTFENLMARMQARQSEGEKL